MVFPHDRQISSCYFAKIALLAGEIGGKIKCEIDQNSGSFSVLVAIGDSANTGECLLLGLSHYRIVVADHGGRKICLGPPVVPSEKDISGSHCFEDKSRRKFWLGAQRKNMGGKEVKQAVVTRTEGF